MTKQTKRTTIVLFSGESMTKQWQPILLQMVQLPTIMK